MGRVSRKQAAENRARVVAAAASLCRHKGIDGTTVSAAMAQAGLTHGGFAGQFGSKEALVAEACAYAFDSAEAAWAALRTPGDRRTLQSIVEFYFAAPRDGCPMATLAGDVARTPEDGPVRRSFAKGVERLAKEMGGGEPDDRSLAAMAGMVGALVLRRAGTYPKLAKAMESAVLRFAFGGDVAATADKLLATDLPKQREDEG